MTSTTANTVAIFLYSCEDGLSRSSDDSYHDNSSDDNLTEPDRRLLVAMDASCRRLNSLRLHKVVYSPNNMGRPFLMSLIGSSHINPACPKAFGQGASLPADVA